MELPIHGNIAVKPLPIRLLAFHTVSKFLLVLDAPRLGDEKLIAPHNNGG